MHSLDDLLFLFLVVCALAFLFSFVTHASAQPSFRTQRSRPAPRRKRVALTEAAQQAMARAGYEPGSEYVQVIDLGLLAYRHAREPKLVRTGAVLMDTRYLRPFADLALPYDASGEVRFELIDGAGRLRYADEARYDLAGGSNTVLPSTWLPLEGKPIPPGDWSLRVLASDALLAVHRFGWQPVGGGAIQRYVASDGELSETLQKAVSARQREAVSLSDLLADQDEQQ